MNKLYLIICIILLLIILGIYNIYNNFSNVGINNCEAIMYINLEDREYRKKLLLADLNKIGVDKSKIHRISAVKIPKNGHKGCIQSHLIALRMAKMNNWKMVCIMEDDAEIININSFNKDVDNIFNDLKDIDWDIINLSCANRKSDSVINKNYIEKLNFATTSACYIIKSHYYDKMINLFEYCNQMMIPEKWGATSDKDDWESYALDQKWNELVKKDNWYCPKNNLIKQRQIKSSIMSRS